MRGLPLDIHKKESISQGTYMLPIISINDKVKTESLAVDGHCYIPGTWI